MVDVSPVGRIRRARLTVKGAGILRLTYTHYFRTGGVMMPCKPITDARPDVTPPKPKRGRPRIIGFIKIIRGPITVKF